MKRKWIILPSLLILILLLAVITYVLLSTSQKNISPSNNSQNPFSSGGDANTANSPIPAKDTVTVALKSGSVISIPDPTKIPQPSGYAETQDYQIAGSDTGDYQVLYMPAKNGGTDEFLISIFAEPVGANRVKAENELQQKLRLSQSQLCQLPDVEVWVSPSANENYAGRNLGLSFCPGATVLP